MAKAQKWSSESLEKLLEKFLYYYSWNLCWI
nr:MAG TPA: hypothetical protein [Bacteriophage sp.]